LVLKGPEREISTSNRARGSWVGEQWTTEKRKTIICPYRKRLRATNRRPPPRAATSTGANPTVGPTPPRKVLSNHGMPKFHEPRSTPSFAFVRSQSTVRSLKTQSGRDGAPTPRNSDRTGPITCFFFLARPQPPPLANSQVGPGPASFESAPSFLSVRFGGGSLLPNEPPPTQGVQDTIWADGRRGRLTIRRLLSVWTKSDVISN